MLPPSQMLHWNCHVTFIIPLIWRPPVCPTCDLKHFALWSVHQVNLSWYHTVAQKLQVLVGVLSNCNWSLHLLSPALRQMFHLPSFFTFFFPRKTWNWRHFSKVFSSSLGGLLSSGSLSDICLSPTVQPKCRLPFQSPVQTAAKRFPNQLCPLLHHCQLALPSTPSSTPCRDLTRGECCTPSGFSSHFSHRPLFSFFFLPDLKTT